MDGMKPRRLTRGRMNRTVGHRLFIFSGFAVGGSKYRAVVLRIVIVDRFSHWGDVTTWRVTRQKFATLSTLASSSTTTSSSQLSSHFPTAYPIYILRSAFDSTSSRWIFRRSLTCLQRRIIPTLMSGKRRSSTFAGCACLIRACFRVFWPFLITALNTGRTPGRHDCSPPADCWKWWRRPVSSISSRFFHRHPHIHDIVPLAKRVPSI